jgi:hypothetical protein
VKAIVLLIAALITVGHAAEKKNVAPGLPQKAAEKDDPLSLERLLDPGSPVPEILPAPEALPEQPASPGGRKRSAGSAKAELISAANDYRQKTTLFRKGKVSRNALRNSAVRVEQAARVYRASLRR